MPPTTRSAKAKKSPSFSNPPSAPAAPDHHHGEIRRSLRRFRSRTDLVYELRDLQSRLRDIETTKGNVHLKSGNYTVKFRSSPTQSDAFDVAIKGRLCGNTGLVHLSSDFYPGDHWHDLLLEVKVKVTVPEREKPLIEWSTSGKVNGIHLGGWAANGFTMKERSLPRAVIPAGSDTLLVKLEVVVITDHEEMKDKGEPGGGSAAWHDERAAIDPRIVERFADFHVVSRQGHRIPCSKVILAARSSAFEAMLTSDSLEFRTGEVDIQDYATVTLRTFLNFLSTNAIEIRDSGEASRMEDELSDEDVVKNLALLADRYLVKSLAEEAGEWLKRRVDAQNAVRMATFAHDVNNEELREWCLNFMVGNRLHLDLSVQKMKEAGLPPELYPKILAKLWK